MLTLVWREATPGLEREQGQRGKTVENDLRAGMGAITIRISAVLPPTSKE